MGIMHDTLQRLLAPGRGVLAPDEHLDRLARVLGVHAVDTDLLGHHRSLYLENPDLVESVSGVVVESDAVTWDSWPSEAPILGVRIGTNTHTFPESHSSSFAADSTEMRARLVYLRDRGAKFVKWRSDADPLFHQDATGYADTANLALCASLSQDVQMLPVLDIAMPAQRAHSLAVGTAVTANALKSLFAELAVRNVDPSAVLVRMNFVRAGSDHPDQTTPIVSAGRTLDVLSKTLPSAAPGVMFMSTGLSFELAAAHLAAVRNEAARRQWMRPMTFAFGYALIKPAWSAWRDHGIEEGRAALAAACRNVAKTPESIGR